MPTQTNTCQPSRTRVAREYREPEFKEETFPQERVWDWKRTSTEWRKQSQQIR